MPIICIKTACTTLCVSLTLAIFYISVGKNPEQNLLITFVELSVKSFGVGRGAGPLVYYFKISKENLQYSKVLLHLLNAECQALCISRMTVDVLSLILQMRCLQLRSQETLLRSDIWLEEIAAVKVVFFFLLGECFSTTMCMCH